MMRTLIDLPDEDVALLDELAQRKGRSRAAEVRDAVRAHLRGRQPDDWIARGRGYWQSRSDIGDGLAYQQGIREDGAVD